MTYSPTVNDGQTRTDRFKGEEKSLISKLQVAAVILRFEGKRYREVQEILQAEGFEDVPSIKTLRTWFAVGGALHEFYEHFSETEGQVRRAEARDIRRARLSDAYRTLASLADRAESEMVRYLAAKEIIEREEGKSVERSVGVLGVMTAHEMAVAASKILDGDAADGAEVSRTPGEVQA